MIRVAFLLTMAAVVATPAAAGTPAGLAQPTTKLDKPEDKVVCRSVNSTGSRLSRQKECHTRAEWDRLSEEAQDDFAQQSSQRPSGQPTPH
jgi:hypothetical protein